MTRLRLQSAPAGLLPPLLCGLVLLGLLAGCDPEESAPSRPVADPLASPAGPGSGQPRLYVEGDSAVWLNWLAPSGDEGHALRYAAFDGTEWTDPETIAAGTDWFVNWADLPSVRPLPDGRRAAHYLKRIRPGAPSNNVRILAYGVRILQTTAEGSWQEPVVSHRDSTLAMHGFVSLVPWTDGRLLAAWLDGGKMDSEGRGGGTTLRSAVLDASGTVERRALVDGRTCECCATSAVRVGDEVLLAYRGRSQEEIRDIRVTRFNGRDWSPPRRLHEDNWQIEGCPVNGPALAADGDRVAAVWFTAADGTPRVKGALSDNGGRRFAEPIEVATGKTQGRVDVALLKGGSAAISWLSSAGDGSVRVRRLGPDGSLSAPVTAATLPSTSRKVGFPRMVRLGDVLYLAWVDPSGDETKAQVRTARLPVERLR